MTAVARTGRPTPYRLVVPRPWVRLPMDPEGMRSAARALLLRRYADQPRDATAAARRALEDELVALTRAQGTGFARMLLLLSLEVQRRPVSASCLVSLLPHAVEPGEAGLAALASELDDHAEVRDVGRHRAVVAVRDRVERPDLPGGTDLPGLADRAAQALGLGEAPRRGAPAWEPGTVRGVDVHLPLPDGEHLLLLSFSTPLPPLFEAMTELFLLIAGSVQFDRGDGSWS